MNRREFIRNAALGAAALAVGRRALSAAPPALDVSQVTDDLSGFPIWDGHCHVFTPGRTPSERMEKLVEVADRMGVERMIIFLSGTPEGSGPMGPLRPGDNPSPELMRRINDNIIETIRDWSSRACGYAYLNPRYLKESLDEVERCVADGPLVGVKFEDGWLASKPELDPILERVAELKGVFFHHTYVKNRGRSNLPQESTPGDLAELAGRHPSVRIVAAHTGGSDWEWGIRQMREHPNMYGETGGSDPSAGFVEMAARELGVERLIYGSDVTGRSFASQIAKVSSTALSPAQKRMIFRDNLRNLLLPILRQKGIKA